MNSLFLKRAKIQSKNFIREKQGFLYPWLRPCSHLHKTRLLWVRALVPLLSRFFHFGSTGSYVTFFGDKIFAANVYQQLVEITFVYERKRGKKKKTHEF